MVFIIALLSIYSFNTYSSCEYSKKSECEIDKACRVAYWQCDYIPKNKSFKEICPNGGKGWKCIQNPAEPKDQNSKVDTHSKNRFKKYQKEQLILLELRLKASLVSLSAYHRLKDKIKNASNYDELIKINTNNLK